VRLPPPQPGPPPERRRPRGGGRRAVGARRGGARLSVARRGGPHARALGQARVRPPATLTVRGVLGSDRARAVDPGRSG
jgi:hypothetical protein